MKIISRSISVLIFLFFIFTGVEFVYAQACSGTCNRGTINRCVLGVVDEGIYSCEPYTGTSNCIDNVPSGATPACICNVYIANDCVVTGGGSGCTDDTLEDTVSCTASGGDSLCEGSYPACNVSVDRVRYAPGLI